MIAHAAPLSHQETAHSPPICRRETAVGHESASSDTPHLHKRGGSKFVQGEERGNGTRGADEEYEMAVTKLEQLAQSTRKRIQPCLLSAICCGRDAASSAVNGADGSFLSMPAGGVGSVRRDASRPPASPAKVAAWNAGGDRRRFLQIDSDEDDYRRLGGPRDDALIRYPVQDVQSARRRPCVTFESDLEVIDGGSTCKEEENESSSSDGSDGSTASVGLNSYKWPEDHLEEKGYGGEGGSNRCRRLATPPRAPPPGSTIRRVRGMLAVGRRGARRGAGMVWGRLKRLSSSTCRSGEGARAAMPSGGCECASGVERHALGSIPLDRALSVTTATRELPLRRRWHQLSADQQRAYVALGHVTEADEQEHHPNQEVLLLVEGEYEDASQHHELLPSLDFPAQQMALIAPIKNETGGYYGRDVKPTVTSMLLSSGPLQQRSSKAGQMYGQRITRDPTNLC